MQLFLIFVALFFRTAGHWPLLSRYCCCTYLEAVFFSAVPGSEPESPGLRIISARHTSISGARACVLVCEQGSHLNPSHITRYQ